MRDMNRDRGQSGLLQIHAGADDDLGERLQIQRFETAQMDLDGRESLAKGIDPRRCGAGIGYHEALPPMLQKAGGRAAGNPQPDDQPGSPISTMRLRRAMH